MEKNCRLVICHPFARRLSQSINFEFLEIVVVQLNFRSSSIFFP